MREYYERRAGEYDDWWLGTGLFAGRDRPRWEEDVAALQAALAGLPPARTLDVACGTGFLSRHLPGELTGLDQSAAMLDVAAAGSRARRSCRATRSTRRRAGLRSSGCTRRTSTGTCRASSAARSWRRRGGSRASS